MRPSPTVRLIALTSLTIALAIVAGVQVSSADDHSSRGAPAGPSAAPDPPQERAKDPKLASSLVELIEASENVPKGLPMSPDNISVAAPSVAAFLKAGLLQVDVQGRVQVYITVPAVSRADLDELRPLGVAAERVSYARGIVQARVPIKALRRLAGLDRVAAVAPPRYGRVDVGSRLTARDALLGFNAVRSTFGVDGSGVTVGVISDGIAGLQDAINLGDLPATTLNRVGGKLVSTNGGVIADSFRADGDLEGGLNSDPGAEGTAILRSSTTSRPALSFVSPTSRRSWSSSRRLTS